MATFPPDRFEVDVRSHLERLGTVHAVFDERTQDSGNVSYGVRVDGRDWFVKTAGRPDDPTRDAFAARVRSLRTAARLAGSVRHPALPRGTVLVPAGAAGPVLVREWVEGELLRDPPGRRGDPATALQRFRRLPVEEVLAAITSLLEAHVELCRAGWVAVDLYLGCLVYHFPSRRLSLVDLDEYHHGPLVNPGDLPGSLSVMSPEERVAGATVDQRSTVHDLARIALLLLGDGTADAAARRVPSPLVDELRRATDPDPASRHADVAELAEAWAAASGSAGGDPRA